MSAPKPPTGPQALTDPELMLWVDGELDPRRAAEVAALVQRDPRSRAVVSALRLASEMIASQALDDAESRGADGIADSVMDAVEAVESAESRRFMTPRRPAPRWRAPAFSAAAMAFAAAAAWMVFIRGALVHSPLVNGPAASSLVAPRAEEPGFADSASASIDVVDFGARPGMIFYVPSEGESAMAVVWLTDDDSPSVGDSQ
jgi:anti-sigma factor RsiW